MPVPIVVCLVIGPHEDWTIDIVIVPIEKVAITPVNRASYAYCNGSSKAVQRIQGIDERITKAFGHGHNSAG